MERRQNASDVGNKSQQRADMKVMLLKALFILLAVIFTCNVWYAQSTLEASLEPHPAKKVLNLVTRRNRARPSEERAGHGPGRGGKASPGEGSNDATDLDINLILDSISNAGPEPILTNPVPEFWWLEDEADDFIHREYSDGHVKRSQLHALRKITHKNPLPGMCGYYRFNTSGLPDVSVIITVQNEWHGLLPMTVHSVLARTPPELLREIIIVDDNGIPPEVRGDGVNEKEFIELEALSPKITVLQNYVREGCARSRLAGARAATGEVLMFIDSHVEMLSSTWLQHLLIPIVENPRTLAMQLIEIIDDLGEHGYVSGRVKSQYGVIDEKFWFAYQTKRFDDVEIERPSERLPYETPFGPGSLFAMRRDEFWRLGGYDKGLYVWGGENTELTLKTWLCGGRVMMVPCSRVGHMYRRHMTKTGRWPPFLPQNLTDKLGCGHPGKFRVYGNRADNFTKIITRNNIRIMNTWVGDHPAKYGYYLKQFGAAALPPEWKQYEDEMVHDAAAQEQMLLKKKNKCHNFEWFDRHVYMKLLGKHHPWYQQVVNCGTQYAEDCASCPKGSGTDWCSGDCEWCPHNEGSCIEALDPSDCPVRKNHIENSQEHNQRKNEKEKETLELKDTNTSQDRRKQLNKKHAALTISVILACGFEHEYFERTARSIFEATPSHVLEEIVIVDDASEPPLEPLFPEASKFKVHFIRQEVATGVTAKHIGATAAKGDVLVFFDCHVKPAPGYWEPFVRAVNENYRRVVVPTITSLNTDTWTEFGRPSGNKGGLSKCYLTFDGEFKWTTDSTPYVPILSGGLLAISRQWYFETGGYDIGMKGWGGENLDQSLRIWRCGGEIVSAPESYVAHMWRDAKHQAKYKIASGDGPRNRAVAIKAHTGPWFTEKTLTFPAFDRFRDEDREPLDTSGVTNSFSDLKCRSFAWYLGRFSYIYRDGGVIPTDVFQLQVVGVNGLNPLCLQLRGHKRWNNAGDPSDKLTVSRCVETKGSDAIQGTQWWHRSNRRVDGSCCSGLRAWNTDQCIAGDLRTSVCSLNPDMEAELTSDGVLHVKAKCLSIDDESELYVGDCKGATKWRKRGSFAPVEFTLLDSSLQKAWQERGDGLNFIS